jgi:hypothetical protein
MGFPESDVNRYHLQLHQDKLIRLCATWDKCLPDFAEMGPLPPWGPSSSQLSKCRVDVHTAARGEDRHYSEDYEYFMLRVLYVLVLFINRDQIFSEVIRLSVRPEDVMK